MSIGQYARALHQRSSSFSTPSAVASLLPGRGKRTLRARVDPSDSWRRSVSHMYTSPGIRPRVDVGISLDPQRLTAAHFLDLTQPFGVHQRLARMRPAGSPKAATLWRPLRAHSLPNHRFPPDSRGFLYYHLPPGAPPLAAEIRFRLTRAPDPRLFAAAPDLLTTWGLPWSIPLLHILGGRGSDPLWPILLADGLVSEDLSARATALSPKRPEGPPGSVSVPGRPALGPSTRILHAFGQPFLLDFSKYQLAFWMVGHDRVSHARLFGALRNGQTRSSAEMPLAGSAICCFEKSTLPEHEGMRAAVLRVLRIVNPVRLRGRARGRLPAATQAWLEQTCPREGELLRTRTYGRAVVWSVDVDAEMAPRPQQVRAPIEDALRVLFENEEHAERASASASAGP
ncbi:hypothetical protein C8Q78DRAFT_344774 [Trametes maxima]|nr:hypothetical protein C8Q78DRAFT_344774 [Trametes maxima]